VLDVPAAMSADSLRGELAAVARDAFLVDGWVMRRVIRLDRRLTGLGFNVPHRKTYTIDSGRLLAYVDRPELSLPATVELPRVVILLAKPNEKDFSECVTSNELHRRYWRLLFHARIHRDVDELVHEPANVQLMTADRIRQIGEIEFAEIRGVLEDESLLFPEASDWDVYVEFLAVYLELHYFSPHDLPFFFPAIQDWQKIDQIASRDVHHQQIYEQTRLGTRDTADAGYSLDSQLSSAATSPTHGIQLLPSSNRLRRWQGKALRAAALGNRVRSAIYWRRAAACVPPAREGALLDAAHQELAGLVDRMREILQLDDEELREWNLALRPVLDLAARSVWSNEARLLADLQKAWIEYESGVYRVDLLGWLRSFGQDSWRRPLPRLREVLLTKHIRAAQRRLDRTQLSLVSRLRVADLLATAVHDLECMVRDRFRILVNQVLDQVELCPQNVPESVARAKLVEELLDHVVEDGFLNTGKFRDALSQSDLKLPDVAGLSELYQGDKLLRADRGLAKILEGVYRPAAIYIRWTQRLSSLAFGTPFGRFLTLYLVLPFGGAYLMLAFISHVYDWIALGPDLSHASPTASLDPATGLPEVTIPENQTTTYPFLVGVGGVGLFLFLMIHRPDFRELFVILLKGLGAQLRFAFVDLPLKVFRIPIVQQILHSPAYATLRSYFIKPALLTFLIGLAARLAYQVPTRHWLVDVFLVSALFLNSPIGRYADEWLTDFVIRAWDELRVKVLAAILHWIMDVFHQLLSGLDRLLFTLDEWSRFRVRDHRLVKLVKLVTGSVWSVVSYFIVFAFTLLIEPQVNPIKHFPVVTVSHKLILPMYPILVKQLSPYMGLTWANTLVWGTIWMVPGVFGFLVWELRENWRLYAANRPRSLRSQPVGLHGESMARILRPGFHSGTLRKLFARLRRATRRTTKAGDWMPINREQTGLKDLRQAIKRFVERELIELLQEARWNHPQPPSVDRVQLATNQVRVTLECRSFASPLSIIWEEYDGVLRARVEPDTACDSLTDLQRQSLHRALGGLFERTGVDVVHGSWGSLAEPEILWADWVQEWTEPRRTEATGNSYLSLTPP
jgi:hypothetical protein